MFIRSSSRNYKYLSGYWSLVANKSVQLYRKGGICLRGLEIKYGIEVRTIQWSVVHTEGLGCWIMHEGGD